MKKRINIKEVSIRNFFSYGNQSEHFDFSQGNLNLVKGKMGAGKSSLFASVPYSLFGKSDRKIPLNRIINSVNRKDSQVNLNIDINNQEIKIARGLNPQIQEISIEGDEITEIGLFQEKLKSLLPISKELFFRIIYLSPKISESFYTLKKQARDKFLDIFIDIELISRMKEMNSEQTSLITHSNSKLAGVKEQLEKRVVELNKKLQSNEKTNIVNDRNILQKELTKIVESFTQLQSKYDKLLIEEEKIQEKVNKFSKARDELEDKLGIIQKAIIGQRSAISNLSKESKKIKGMKLEEEICQKEIDAIVTNFRNQISAKTEELIKIEKREKEISKKVKEVNKKINDLDSKLGESDRIKKELRKIKDDINNKKFELKELEIILSKDEEILSEVHQSLQEIEDDLDTIEIDRVINVRKGQITNLAKNVLNSRIKPYLMSKIYPFLQKQINHYFEVFNEPLIVSFSNGEDPIFKSPGRASFIYGNFSDGERIIIDLATMLAFKDLLEYQLGLSVNVLIFDEYVTHLPLKELNNIIPKIKEISEIRDWNTFMVSHNPNIQTQSFDNVYEVQKIDRFSKIIITDD